MYPYLSSCWMPGILLQIPLWEGYLQPESLQWEWLLDSWHHGVEGRLITLPLTGSEAKTHNFNLNNMRYGEGQPGFESWYCHSSAVRFGASHPFTHVATKSLSSS